MVMKLWLLTRTFFYIKKKRKKETILITTTLIGAPWCCFFVLVYQLSRILNSVIILKLFFLRIFFLEETNQDYSGCRFYVFTEEIPGVIWAKDYTSWSDWRLFPLDLGLSSWDDRSCLWHEITGEFSVLETLLLSTVLTVHSTAFWIVGHALRVVEWVALIRFLLYVSLLINTRFRFFYFRISNC